MATAPIMVGDRLIATGERVIGFVLLPDQSGRLTPGVDSSRDYVLAERPNAPYAAVPIDHLPDGSWESSGVDPLGGVTSHPMSEEWAARFEDSISFAAHPWAQWTSELVDSVHASGWRLFPAGGLVRNLLLGVDPRDPLSINDMDLAGTVPPTQFRTLLSELNTETAGGDIGRLDRPPQLRTSANQVVHVTRVVGSAHDMSVEREPALQYAMLKSDWLDIFGVVRLVTGTRLADDARWRDVTYNDLFYDRATSSILDPSGSGLADLGIAPGQLLGSADAMERTTMIVRVVDPPENAPQEYWSAMVARVIKQVRDYPAADFGPVRTWFNARREHLDQLVSRLDLRSKLADLDHDPAKPLPSLDLVTATLGEEFARWYARVVGTTRSPAVAGRGGPLLIGTALAPIDPAAPTRLGRAEGPDRPTPHAANQYFAERLASYEHVIVPIKLAGETYDVLGLRDTFEYGPTFVELDQTTPIPVTEKQLAEIRTADRSD